MLFGYFYYKPIDKNDLSYSGSPISSPTSASPYEGRDPPCNPEYEISCDSSLKFGAVCCIKLLQICGGAVRDSCEDCCKLKICTRMTIWPYLMSCRVVEDSSCSANTPSTCKSPCTWTCGVLSTPTPIPLQTPISEPSVSASQLI